MIGLYRFGGVQHCCIIVFSSLMWLAFWFCGDIKKNGCDEYYGLLLVYNKGSSVEYHSSFF